MLLTLYSTSRRIKAGRSLEITVCSDSPNHCDSDQCRQAQVEGMVIDVVAVGVKEDPTYTVGVGVRYTQQRIETV